MHSIQTVVSHSIQTLESHSIQSVNFIQFRQWILISIHTVNLLVTMKKNYVTEERNVKEFT